MMLMPMLTLDPMVSNRTNVAEPMSETLNPLNVGDTNGYESRVEQSTDVVPQGRWIYNKGSCQSAVDSAVGKRYISQNQQSHRILKAAHTIQ